MPHPFPPVVRILANMSIDNDTKCWNWRGHKSDGYGRLGVKLKRVLAHRQSYNDFVGDIPAGKELDHLCRNKACVNPLHLEPVTNVENMRRANAAGAARGSRNITHCKNGHPFNEENTRLTPKGWRDCRECGRIKMRELRAKYSNLKDQMK